MMNGIDRSARDHAAEIVAVLDDGDNEGAADLAGQALTAFPDAAVFQRLRGVALFALGANAEAKAHLDAALAIDPLDNEAILALARLADAEGDPYTAAEHLLTAWEHDPANSGPPRRTDRAAGGALRPGRVSPVHPPRPRRPVCAQPLPGACRAGVRRHSRRSSEPHRPPPRRRTRAVAIRQSRRDGASNAPRCSASSRSVVRARWALADATARRGNGDARARARQTGRPQRPGRRDRPRADRQQPGRGNCRPG